MKKKTLRMYIIFSFPCSYIFFMLKLLTLIVISFLPFFFREDQTLVFLDPAVITGRKSIGIGASKNYLC